MPLEQIGSNLRLFGKPSNEAYDSQPVQGYDNETGTSEHLPDEFGQWSGSHDDSTILQNSETSRYHQDEDMTLHNLGGVGGVQRSGSWAYGSRYSGRPSAFQNPLYDSPEDSDLTTIDNKVAKNHRDPSPNSGKQVSPRSIPWRSSSLRENDSQRVNQDYKNSPSTISRSSTSSSSTAAFSLRSLSNRNSTSSNGSSAGSSMQRLTSDEGHTNSVSSTVSGYSSTTITSEDASMKSESTIGRSTDSNRRSYSKHDSPLADQDGYSSSSSQVGPRVQRIQSIGRGFDVRKWNSSERKDDVPTDANGVSDSTEKNEERRNSLRSSGHTETESKDNSLQEEDSSSEENAHQLEGGECGGDTVDNEADDPNESAADQTAIAKDRDDTILSLSHSPNPLTDTSELAYLSTETQSDLSQSGEFKPRLGSLTLTAAAQADRSEDDRPTFVPPEPRRHTGSYALRSRSVLSQTLGSSSLQFGNGQGRAAARKGLAAAAAAGRASLDNDQLNSIQNTPRANALEVQATRSSPAEVSAWQSKAFAISNLSQSGLSSQGGTSSAISPRTLPKELTMSPSLDQAMINPTSVLDTGASLLSPIARASPDALALFNAVSLDSSVSPRLRNAPYSPSPSEEGMLGLSRESNSASHSSLDVSDTGNGPASGDEMNAGSETMDYPRSSLARSATSLVGMNVLRTPTTEEWSRYLIKRGLDPTLIASSSSNTGGGSANRAVYKGSRSRTNTSRSAVAGLVSNSVIAKRRISDREGGWGRTNSLNNSTEALTQDFVNKANERGSLTSMPNDLILAEIARQQQLRQRVSGTADELRSVHEDENDAVEVLDDEDDREIMERLSQADFDEDDIIESDEEELSDGMDERMRALHEAISRPPSRRGTPAPSESGRERISEATLDSTREINDARRNLRWPTRDTAASLADYPLPPTGEQRTIHDFVIVDDIGRGAYGLVKKARVRDEKTGEPIGPEFAIKYIIKSRILADCWRRHKALGPIPVEIHVLDQLRRLAYAVPKESPGWSAERLFDCSAIPTLGSTKVETEEGDHVLVTVGHPSLCMMVDFFEDHEFYYMVMPRFGSGQDLFDYVESQPHGLTTKHVRCIFGQLADGLKFLHANNIVHRDVKDENVILDGNGHIQLIDFGSAAHIQSKRLFDTFSGTLDYAAAEILRGEKYGGKEQDVWALGVVGYVLLCGDCPFWNGEEAMEGLQMGTRAFTVLADRKREISKAEAMEGFSNTATPTTLNPMLRDSFSGQTITTSLDEAEKVVSRRNEDIQGQIDGGGRLDDAADLIVQCLCLEPGLRPTMEQICQHRFLIGNDGWIGRKGWENVKG